MTEVVNGRCSLEMRQELCLAGGHSHVTRNNIQRCIQVLLSLSEMGKITATFKLQFNPIKEAYSVLKCWLGVRY